MNLPKRQDENNEYISGKELLLALEEAQQQLPPSSSK